MPLLLVPILSLLVNGYIARLLLYRLDVRLSFYEWYGLAVANSLGNYLPIPQAGAVARAVYLRKVHRLNYHRFAASLLVTYISAVALYGVTGLVCLGAMSAQGNSCPIFLWFIFAALASSSMFLTPVATMVPLPKSLLPIREGLSALIGYTQLLKIVFLQLILICLTTSGLWLACKAMQTGSAVSWPTALVMGLLLLASGIINVTPGNIGIEQATTEVTARLLRIAPNIGFLASSIFRVVSALVVIAISPVFIPLMKRMNRADNPSDLQQ